MSDVDPTEPTDADRRLARAIREAEAEANKSTHDKMNDYLRSGQDVHVGIDARHSTLRSLLTRHQDHVDAEAERAHRQAEKAEKPDYALTIRDRQKESA